MKNLKIFIAVFAISTLSIFSTFSSETEPKTTNQKIREKIVNLLGDKIQLELKKDKEIEISFLINNKNEVVVMSVESSETSIESFVKDKLNYKKLEIKGMKKGEIYRVPLKVKKSK